MEPPITEHKKGKEKSQREKQTYFRVAFKNNCNLLQIADNKANIIITINSVVISSTIAVLGYGTVSHRIQLDSLLTIGPVLLFLSVILASTMLAVQAAKPSIIGTEKRPNGKPRSSLLFFAESSKFSLEDYLSETHEMLENKGEILDQMTTSLYYQGKVLNRKYRLVRKAYEIFLLGLAVGILSFIGFIAY
ncbi:metal-dependent phosphohydrolase [Algoriphagus sp. H41]|uniref:Metal-dependent phosphohydrolase n=1 Tax=Algoriphagus oliviformis TaxID=2811231 RepID=A0ABS3C5U6_9BACT|nr:Pycsar system effector family protein [Algoriphagus oliviformis]MBN7812466.1 metal-dependent phosphohydrolase [Algoriphagus oliviformis]